MGKLAADKYGSHVVEAVWSAADLNKRQQMAEVLAKSIKQLQDSRYGSILLSSFDIESFVHGGANGRAEWMARQQQSSKKKRLFDDILNA